jgi:hypothetical protein
MRMGPGRRLEKERYFLPDQTSRFFENTMKMAKPRRSRR